MWLESECSRTTFPALLFLKHPLDEVSTASTSTSHRFKVIIRELIMHGRATDVVEGYIKHAYLVDQSHQTDK